MNRTLLLMAVAAVATSGVKAQSVTYNHDSPKQNQITVMETGTGALSPELYYTLLHNKYKKSAASKNKLSFRTLAGILLHILKHQQFPLLQYTLLFHYLIYLINFVMMTYY